MKTIVSFKVNVSFYIKKLAVCLKTRGKMEPTAHTAVTFRTNATKSRNEVGGLVRLQVLEHWNWNCIR